MLHEEVVHSQITTSVASLKKLVVQHNQINVRPPPVDLSVDRYANS